MKRVFCFDHFYLLPREIQNGLKAAMDGPNGDLAVHRHSENGGSSMAQRAVALIERSIRNGAKPPPKKFSTWIPARRSR